MSKKKASHNETVESKEFDQVETSQIETQEEYNPEPIIGAPQSETKEILSEDSPEVLTKKEQVTSLEAELKLIQDNLKAKKIEIRNMNQEIKSLLTGEKIQKISNHKFVFISNGQTPKEMKTKKDKPLSYQGQLLVTMFIGDAPAGTELTYSREEVLAKLEDYPCIGDKMDNFAWYKSQVFKPMGLVK
jgi:hypothetical protein